MITCFDIGGSSIKVAVAHSPDKVVAGRTLPTPLHDFEAFVATMQTLIADGPPAAHQLVSISICGVVDPETGALKCANIPCIDGRTLDQDLEHRLGCVVLVANDADCFTMAEAVAGAGRGHRVVFGAILGTGVGGGLVIDGTLLTGAGGYAGEWGHGPITATQAGNPAVDVPRFACGCGQVGCVDAVGGARGLERLHAHLHSTTLRSTDIMAQWLNPQDAHHAQACQTMDCYVDLVAEPLALVVNVVGASVIPVGGGLSNVKPLLSRLDSAVRARILRTTHAPLVVPSQCTVEPGLIGAGILGLNKAQA
ncbi:ROK family protein [Rhodoferax aquaticus]|uniref:ROK family protein n=1 Tax=Rhodoferax aquaticus TaxID=2527691 RepID=A0A515ESE5_9BURK|nr:ROK family protein [Rhodoferax aquaticus]QDL55579.1 ROK family protein [Rhodoferax aquaticus]